MAARGMVRDAPQHPELAELQAFALEVHSDLVRRAVLPNPGLGGQLFLGRHFARSDVVHFGLNPGVEGTTLDARGETSFDVSLLEQNVLLDQTAEKFRYWTNARKFFAADGRVRRRMENATFSFCVPWRSYGFADVRRCRGYGTLLRRSGEVATRLLDACEARLLIVSGKEARGLLDLPAFLPALSGVVTVAHWGSGTYQAGVCQGTLAGRRVTVVQTPHFSRAPSSGQLGRLLERIIECVPALVES